MSNLYNTFGCENKEQLYNKIISGVDDIRPLLDFLDYAKGTLASKEKPIQSDQTFHEYVRKVDKPTKKNISRIDEILKVIGIEMVDKMKYIEADNEFISYRNENTFSGLYNYPEY